MQLFTDSPIYQKAFEQYLRKGTPIEVSVKRMMAHKAETAANHHTRRYMWLTSGDEKVRPSHATNDGMIFYWSDPPPTGHPGEDFNCRCVAAPYVDMQDAALLAVGSLVAITPLNRGRVLASRVLRAAIRGILRREEAPPAQKPSEPRLDDTKTWPAPPRQGKFREGDPSRYKPRSRGEKSLYDEKDGEWRYAPEDKYHNAHWDYKPAGKAQEWQNISVDGRSILK